MFYSEAFFNLGSVFGRFLRTYFFCGKNFSPNRRSRTFKSYEHIGENSVFRIDIQTVSLRGGEGSKSGEAIYSTFYFFLSRIEKFKKK